jgi:PRTRC genetic system protein E
MFIELTPILKERVVMITASDIGNGFLRVNVIPKSLGTDDNPALTTPLTLTGTPEELDRELAAQLASFSESIVKAGSNLETLKTEHSAAVKAVEAENKKKLDEKKKTAGTKNGTPAGIKETTAPEVKDAKPVFGTKAQPAAPRELNLFDTADECAAQGTPHEPSDAIDIPEPPEVETSSVSAQE